VWVVMVVMVGVVRVRVCVCARARARVCVGWAALGGSARPQAIAAGAGPLTARCVHWPLAALAVGMRGAPAPQEGTRRGGLWLRLLDLTLG
jgi:hypothetical protein